MTVTAGPLDAAHPVTARESMRVADGVTLMEDGDGSGAVFLWGKVAWSWAAGDPVARRLAAVQLVATRAVPQRRVADAFGVNEDSVIRWRGKYATKGTAGLAGRRPGPKGPFKLTEAKRTEIGALRAKGLTLANVADQVGVSTDTVRRALARRSPPVAEAPLDGPGTASPRCEVDRELDRHSAPDDSIAETAGVREGSSVPLAGTLIILPALASTGLLDEAARVHETGAAASAGLRTRVLSCVFADVHEPDIPGWTDLDVRDIDRLLGLDRAHDADAACRRVRELSTARDAAALVDALARRHLEAHDEVHGAFYLGGHVRVYHDSAEVAGAALARIRLSIGGDLDVRALDRDGAGVLTWNTPPGASAAEELRAVATEVRTLVGPDAHPTVCFDHSGWPPKLFAELDGAGFELVSHAKGSADGLNGLASPLVPAHRVTDERGRVHEYVIDDRGVLVDYDNGRRRFSCRQITRLDPRTRRHVHVLTTRNDLDAATIADAAFPSEGQQDFVDHMRALRHRRDADPSAAGGEGIDDAVRMATHNARSSLVRLLSRLLAGSADVASGLLGEAFRAPGDVRIIGDQLHVRLGSLSTPQRTQAVAALTDQLTETNTGYPGTDLTLIYSVRDHH